MKNFALIISILFLTSCAISREVYTPEGDKAYNIDCSGSAMSKSQCIKKAGDICKSRGYTEIDYREEVGPGLSLAGVTIPGMINRNMTIKCN